MAQPDLSLHEWSILLVLIEAELERTPDTTADLNRILNKIEASVAV